MVTRDQWAGLAETFISFNSRTQVASYCLFYYDYLLTLPTEVRMVWGQRRLTLQSFFYLAIRYGCFVQITGTMFHNFNPTRGVEIIHAGTTCQAMGRAGAVLNLLNFCVISAFVALRLYAMYDRNWVLGILLFLLGSCSPTTIPQSIAWVFEEIHTPWPLPPCTEFIHGTKAYALYILNGQILPLSLSISSAVYELLCLSLTAAKTIRLYKLHRSIETIPITPSVTGLLLRDGTVYFAVLLMLAVLNICFSVTSMASTPDGWQRNSDFARVIGPILTTHFIAHLQSFRTQEGRFGNTNAIDELSSLGRFKLNSNGRNHILDSISGDMVLDAILDVDIEREFEEA